MRSQFRALVLLVLIALALGSNGLAQEFRIPEISELPRVEKNSPRPSTYHLRNSAFILKFKKDEPRGNGYVILTDHTEAGYLQSLERLSKHRKGTIIKTKDLANVHQPEILEDEEKSDSDARANPGVAREC